MATHKLYPPVGLVARLRRYRHPAGIAGFAMVTVAALAWPVVQNLGRWPLSMTIRRAAAAPNCAAAPAVGLGPAYRVPARILPAARSRQGDKAGIACEPWPRRSPRGADRRCRYKPVEQDRYGCFQSACKEWAPLVGKVFSPNGVDIGRRWVSVASAVLDGLPRRRG